MRLRPLGCRVPELVQQAEEPGDHIRLIYRRGLEFAQDVLGDDVDSGPKLARKNKRTARSGLCSSSASSEASVKNCRREFRAQLSLPVLHVEITEVGGQLEVAGG